ncbi:hypothetical protein [Blastochloris sulfoviridis]|nr:hypothetical protein [Blastochloris sulfoviridis]
MTSISLRRFALSGGDLATALAPGLAGALVITVSNPRATARRRRSMRA